MSVKKITAAAFYLALCYILPFLSGNIPAVGNMLCLIHIPVILAGFTLGWQYGLFLGIIAPLTRSLMFGSPIFYPNAIGMAVELGIYGLASGLFYKLFSKINRTAAIYLSLIIAMVLGRIAWGGARCLLLLFNTEFSLKIFIAGAFLNAWPGIILQILLIPPLVKAYEKVFGI